MRASWKKRLVVLGAVLAAMSGGGCVMTTRMAVPAVQGPERPVVTVLATHGEWIVVAGLGHVWRPHRHIVGVSFTPYVTGGRWIYTTAGWEFESRWDWGWRVFHYGYWIEVDGYGWVWVPGDVWAPAWVEWRTGGGYVGWTPLPPPGVRIVVRTRWCYVPAAAMVSRRWVETEVLPPDSAHRATAVATTPVHPSAGHPVSPGPPIDYVERHAGIPVEVHRAAPPGWRVGKSESVEPRPAPQPPPSGGWSPAPAPPPGSGAVSPPAPPSGSEGSKQEKDKGEKKEKGQEDEGQEKAPWIPGRPRHPKKP